MYFNFLSAFLHSSIQRERERARARERDREREMERERKLLRHSALFYTAKYIFNTRKRERNMGRWVSFQSDKSGQTTTSNGRRCHILNVCVCVCLVAGLNSLKSGAGWGCAPVVHCLINVHRLNQTSLHTLGENTSMLAATICSVIQQVCNLQ